MILPCLRQRSVQCVPGRRQLCHRYQDSIYKQRQDSCCERFFCRLFYSVSDSLLSEIVVVDPCYCTETLDEIMDTYRITDVLILYSGNTFFTDKISVECLQVSNRIKEEFIRKREPVRLNKYLSEAGVCSRREADRLIESGKVTVDGRPAVTGMRIIPGQIVKVGRKTVSKQDDMIVLAVNKPKGIVCTEEKRERNSIVRFLNYPVRVTYVGRLIRTPAVFCL